MWMDLVDSKYIGLVSSRLPKFKRVKTDLIIFVVLSVGIPRSIRTRREDISIKLRQIPIIGAIIVVLVCLLIIFLSR